MFFVITSSNVAKHFSGLEKNTDLCPLTNNMICRKQLSEKTHRDYARRVHVSSTRCLQIKISVRLDIIRAEEDSITANKVLLVETPE